MEAKIIIAFKIQPGLIDVIVSSKYLVHGVMYLLSLGMRTVSNSIITLVCEYRVFF